MRHLFKKQRKREHFQASKHPIPPRGLKQPPSFKNNLTFPKRHLKNLEHILLFLPYKPILFRTN